MAESMLPTGPPPWRWMSARCVTVLSVASGWRVMIGMAVLSGGRINGGSAAGQRCVPARPVRTVAGTRSPRRAPCG